MTWQIHEGIVISLQRLEEEGHFNQEAMTENSVSSTSYYAKTASF